MPAFRRSRLESLERTLLTLQSVVPDERQALVDHCLDMLAEAFPEPKPPRSTWPEACPSCGAPWQVKSKTMGRAHGQPHQGTCQNGHRWSEP